ncbi:nucleic acid-binding protein [Mangrovimicrobium sediminis]|uniref:Nucleic acid-binding protein n=1 Tax=Mangrovimicrobium sediminis TaxID=2562682 RepID=A0A4Z0LVQ5_9GAMM|nr:OB-fold domain-containing protein [Haliea sp. SAOS-164]TGD71277.1 nucleic acid-binding protein [Haliea sp. SAOS-164]
MSATDQQPAEHPLMGAVRQYGGDPVDLPFWEACAQGSFLLHQCGQCGRHYWPASRCIEHGDAAMSWVAASGRGEVYTYTVMHRAYTPDTRDKVPFVIAVVRLEEGPFYHSNIVDCPHDAVAVGMPLEVVMQPHPSGLTIPQFRPRGD